MMFTSSDLQRSVGPSHAPIHSEASPGSGSGSAPATTSHPTPDPRQPRQRHQHIVTMRSGDTRDIVTSQPRSPCITECGSLCWPRGREWGWETDAAWELIWILSSQAPHVPAPSSSPAKPAPGHTCSTFPHILRASLDPIHINLKQT